MHENSPSSVMYAELKALGVNNHDAAITLLDTDSAFGESTLRNRIESRAMLSRNIVHVAPGELDPSLFRSFSATVPKLMRLITESRSKKWRGEVSTILENRLRESAAQSMEGALAEYGIEPSIYENAIGRISSMDLPAGNSKALLYLMLFVVTGCTGDPREGAHVVERTSKEYWDTTFNTPPTTFGEPAVSDIQGTRALGLIRVVDGHLKGNSFHLLATDGQRTEIGAFCSGDGAITDVDGDVSSRHAAIYEDNGRWYIVGLGSLNGTAVISGEDKIERVVEPPRRKHSLKAESEPYELFPADTICLGATTRYMVMPLLD